MKLSKPQIKKHDEACKLLEKDILTYDDKLFVLENWQESATNINSKAGAFFTPPSLASDFTIECYGDNVIDLCAGIGSLSFALLHKGYRANKNLNITCVEINPNYVEVGKKIIPEATWICGSIFDDVGCDYDLAISNPPFGNIHTGKDDNDGLGGFEFSTIKRASQVAKNGVFILPQNSTPFRYSGARYYQFEHTNKSSKFVEKTGINFDFNCGIDTGFYKDQWKGVSPVVEICTFDFTIEVNK